MLPKDPVMLLSFINLKLRDYDYDLEALCDDLDVAQADLTEKPAGIDDHSDRQKKQLV